MKKRAFTLAELLTAVLVISIIMVALAPVITKRMQENISVEDDDRQGLKVYTNPGDYVFDVPNGINTLFIQGSGGGGGGAGATYVEKEMSVTSTSHWEVPPGVNQVTLTITGAGGGGGGGYAKANSIGCSAHTKKVVALADNGKDLCISGPQTPENKSVWGEITTENSGTALCTSEACCWKNIDSDEGKCTSARVSGGTAGCGRTVCTYAAASGWCSNEVSESFPKKEGISGGRLISSGEAQRAVNKGNILDPNYWDVCYHKLYASCPAPVSFSTSRVPECRMGGQNSANGAHNGYAYPDKVWLLGMKRIDMQVCGEPTVGSTSVGYSRFAFSVFCTYELDSWSQYSGAGGASGAVLEKTIDVTPGDILRVNIGTGGTGGSANANGSSGGVTYVEHYSNSALIAKYSVKSGKGGNKATQTANGEAYTNEVGSSSSMSTSQDACQVGRRNTSGSLVTENVACKLISYSGSAGTETKGGNGGMVENKGTTALGGELGEEEGTDGRNKANGANASVTNNGYGFGGGGGTCARGVRSASLCSKGGNGAQGKVVFKYNVILPGGGGGSAARVAGNNGDADNPQLYEIKYNVEEGSKLAVRVGYGGTGGVAGQNGLNGTVTTVADDDIIFMAGEGGKISTETEKASLIGGAGGNSGYVNEAGQTQNVSRGVKLKNSSITYTISPPTGAFKGQNGGRGGVPNASDIDTGYSLENSKFSYGLSGGMGGSPFNVASSLLVPSITCAGGVYDTIGLQTSLKYLCATGTMNGNNGKMHSAGPNEYGGSGGGGGGAILSSNTYGAGGDGSNGYLRIRWDVAEQN